MTTPQHPYANKLPYTLTTWRECVIWCACVGGGWQAVNAWVYGVMALHPSPNNDFWWTLTHIPTGKKLFDARFDTCRYEAERLTALGDWNTRAVGKLKALREAM